MVTMEKSEPLETLLQLYKERIDLQDAFPEVNQGEYQALINWAAGVSEKRWKDKAYDDISNYKKWFLENESEAIRPKNEYLIREIFKNSEKGMNKALSEIMSDKDISEHLTTLFFLVIEFNLKNILELGVRDGISTIALTEAASQINGHVYSVDIDSCESAKIKLKELGLDKYWTFLQGNDLEIGKKWEKELDHIFIDTSHSYNQTLQELKIFEPFLCSGGFITFHDTRAFPGVLRAIKDFINENKNKFHFYNYFNNNGFAILRKS